MSVSTAVTGRAVARGNSRWEQTMEIVARAYGATYPRMVAAALGPDCPDVAAALQALRERHPQWFASAAESGKPVASSQ
jgi:hypothetical protein